MSNEKSGNGGVGFAGLLFVLFLGLKLGHVIAWSWWWVFAPLWIPAGIALVVIIVIVVAAVVRTRR